MARGPEHLRIGEGSGKTFCFDLDGTLCTNTHGEYESAQPFAWAINRVNELARAGHRIIIFTARGATTGIDWSDVTKQQLAQWGVSYDQLQMGKPGADVYVDDRALHMETWRSTHSLATFTPGSLDGTHVTVPFLTTSLPLQRSGIVEIGRTFNGIPFQLKEHVTRLVAVAEASGVPIYYKVAEIEAAITQALEIYIESLATDSDDETIFTLALSAMTPVAYIDTLDDALGANLSVSCRLLGQVLDYAPLLRFAQQGVGEPCTIFAATDRQLTIHEAWPFWVDTDGRIGDMLGGELVAVVDGALVLASSVGVPSIARMSALRLAEELDIATRESSLTTADLCQADEVFIVNLPFCILSVTKINDQEIGQGLAGPVTRTLLSAWSEMVEVDITAQLRHFHQSWRGS